MTEKEYIDVKELGIVTSAKGVLLNGITPEISTVITQEDFQTVYSILCQWERLLHKEVSISSNQ